MRHLIPALIAAAALIAAPATASEKRDPEAKLAKLLEGRVAGEPQKCIFLPSVRNSQVIDETAIVYRIGGTLWVNRPKGAESLDDDDILLTRTTGSQLCNIDTVELRDRSSRMFSGFVSLGDFVPYRLAKAE